MAGMSLLFWTRVSYPDQTPEAIMKAIFPQSIDSDFLNFVHLSNGFRMLDGASPPHIGDVVAPA